MGVPKFFRYISERYPCLSEVIKEYQIPEFDNLYLDMNGIIHNCSHPNDFDPHFRITEKQIFQDIFHYIEVLFRMIQPKKLFFMAIDGVAPRAKMNQQRGRRFRSAKEAELLEAKAKEKGEDLPKEKRFDSNCITPGTPFMCRLHDQLRYFVKLKMTTDKLWKNVNVILSGHETPGEGEHKIMDYIRYMKSKPDYNPNLRHCLYGLDADLIMLGLCTHEPYFSLLREEVKFNQSSNKGGSSKILTPEETKFFLLHLSLMRDYLELEFDKIREPGVLPFPFDIEKLIDDWVLMGFLIGNDFIPNLPDLHIIDGALPLMFKVYQEVLPTLDGYLNEAGDLNLPRFEKFMQKLASFDFEHFREQYADIQYLEGKTGKKFSENFPKEKVLKKNMDPDLAALIKATEDDFDFDDDDTEVLNYADYDEFYFSDEDNEWRLNFFTEFTQHKTDYYKYKLDYDKVTNDVLKDQAECYIRAIQWNLHYYYNGCVSWSWYYPHHYAPYISDIKGFSDLSLTYDLGKPFLPFQQLLAVLPAASKDLLPNPYQKLMTLESSPIFDFYPTEFSTDMNGKKQEWEAVVLIPFIDENKLLVAMKNVEHYLSDEERNRNQHGPMLSYVYSEQSLGMAEAPQHFPPIVQNHAIEHEIWREQIYVNVSKLVKGLCKNVNMNLYRTKFPTLKHLNFTSKLESAKVKVFQQPSRNESVILTLENPPTPGIEHVAEEMLGKTVLIEYPHLIEVRVTAISTKEARISLDKQNSQVVEKASKEIADQFELSKKSLTDDYYSKQGIVIGTTEMLLIGNPVESRKYFFGSHGTVSQQRTYIRGTYTYAFQTGVFDTAYHPKSTLEQKSIDDIFYPGCHCYTLSNPYYGSEGKVIETLKGEITFVKLSLKVQQEPNLIPLANMKDTSNYTYLPAYTIANKLAISPLLLSRLTGCIFIVNREDEKKVNIALNIKFNKKNEEVVGFTRRDEVTKKWFYTDKVVSVIRDYMQIFPEVFDFLTDNPSNDIYIREEVFPVNGEERVKEIAKWLKEQPHASAEVRSCGASVVGENIVELIEKQISSVEAVEKKVTLLIKPNKLYIPKPTLDKMCPDPDTKFALFDRIVNIRDCYTVPLGYRGTIIGITQGETIFDTMYDVLFDQPFPHGIKIRCSESRGYRLSGQAMINLSHGERLNGGAINPHLKNSNIMRNRGEKYSSYSNASKASNNYNQKQETSNTRFFKEKSPNFSTRNQPSPYYNNNNAHYCQQSSPSTYASSRVAESPSSINSSKQPSPLPVRDRKDIKSSKPIVSSKNNVPVTVNNITTETNIKTYVKKENAPSVVINKEERSIFSIPTFPIPTTQLSSMSFFGPSNILDMPEVQNKLFNRSDDSDRTIDLTKKNNVGKNSSQQEKLQSPSGSESSIKCSPSISYLVKQHNITAKTEFSKTESVPEVVCMNSPIKNSIQEPTTVNEPKFTSNFFTQTNDASKLASNPIVSTNPPQPSSENQRSKENIFEKAISAMIQQSPLLLEGNSKSLPTAAELSFEQKHEIKNDLPTIITEMRKVTKTDSHDEDEEEEVMIIEMDTKTEQDVLNPLQNFFSKIKISDTNEESKQVLKDKNISFLENVESNQTATVNDVTADTINAFFVRAEEDRKKRSNESANTHGRSQEKTKDQKKNGLDAGNVLMKMLNIDRDLCSSSTTQPTIEHNEQPTREANVNDPDVQNKLQNLFNSQPSSSAFKTVPARLNDEDSAVPKQNILLATLQKKPTPSVSNPFIPLQVQKKITSNDQITKVHDVAVLEASMGPQRSVSSTQNTSSQPMPGMVIHPSLHQNVQHAHHPHMIKPIVLPPHSGLSNSMPASITFSSNVIAAPRGTPILGSNARPAGPNQIPPQYYSQGSNMQSVQYYGIQHGAQPYNLAQQVNAATGQPLIYQQVRQAQNNGQVYAHPRGQHPSVVPLSYIQQPHHTMTSQGYFQPSAQPCPLPSVPSVSQLDPEATPFSGGMNDKPVNTFVLKLLQLTKHYNLGVPIYTCEEHDNKSVTASVRIPHPHSELFVRGKACTKKGDAVEICARRAYNELTQSFPPITQQKIKEDKKSDTPSESGESSSTDNENKSEQPGNQRKPKMAAKFNVPIKPKY